MYEDPARRQIDEAVTQALGLDPEWVATIRRENWRGSPRLRTGAFWRIRAEGGELGSIPIPFKDLVGTDTCSVLPYQCKRRKAKS